MIDIVILVIGLVLIGLVSVATILYLLLGRRVGGNSSKETLEEAFAKSGLLLKDEMSRNREENAKSEKRLREELRDSLKDFGDSMDKKMLDLTKSQNTNFESFSKRLSELIDKNKSEISLVREIVEKRLELLQKDNNEKIESMRATVDEKLHKTLEKRFDESFKLVGKQLAAVQHGVGEMQNLAEGVGDLKKIMTNVKSRGTWGEAQLGNLIEEIFSPDQYEKNFATKKESGERVEYAIKLPGKSDEIGDNVWLPIDAKFPLEDYQKLVSAQEKGGVTLKDTIETIGKSFEEGVKREAKKINEKYLNPPITTDFGVLFVPTESLFAEILRRPGLFEAVRQKYKITIAGPTTMQALLNSFQVGFKTLAIQKKSSEVWKVLETIKYDYGKFGEILEKTHKKIMSAGSEIESAIRKTKNIDKKLSKVESLPTTHHNQLESDTEK